MCQLTIVDEVVTMPHVHVRSRLHVWTDDAQTLLRARYTNVEVRADRLKIVIPGGSGQVGTLLARALTSAGRDVVVLRRKPRADPWRVPVCDGGDHR